MQGAMPEQSSSKMVTASTLIGVVSGVPVVGGGVAGAIQGAVQAASRARDEEWWAMIAARLTSLEHDVQEMVSFDDRAFLAALHRLTRASQETEDNEKRRRLAAALAYSGSWSSLRSDQRDRMERILIESTSREVHLLRVFADPEAWLAQTDPEAIARYRSMQLASIEEFIDGHIVCGDPDEKRAVEGVIESLSRRGLVQIPTRSMLSGAGVLQGRATSLGHQFISYLQEIENESSGDLPG